MIEEEIKSTEAEAERRIYEVGFQIVPSVPQDKIGTEFSALREFIEKVGGAIIGEEMPKMMPLAYTIKQEKAGKYTKYNQAYFGWIKFESEPAEILEIDKKLKEDQNILRYILIKTVKENTINRTPKIPSFSKNKGSDKVASEKEGPKVEVSDEEIDEALDAAIAE